MVFYCQMIYSPETDRYSKTRLMLWLLNVWLGAHNIHDIHTLCINMAWCCDEPVSLAFWHLVTSNLLHCLMPTARSFLRLAGQVPQLPRHPRWPHFPQGPCTPPSHRPLQPQSTNSPASNSNRFQHLPNNYIERRFKCHCTGLTANWPASNISFF
jgi:hypothetical protein